MSKGATALHQEIAACQICAANLEHGPRPIVQFSARSRLCIIGQAPGSKVHASGTPWDDDSGDRLRDWLQLDKADFYNADKISLVPMGFCYPGKASGGDKPPRKECAPAWHQRVLATMPDVRLTLLVGTYAQAAYMPEVKRLSQTDRVRQYANFAPYLPLPHPAWRVRMWMAKNAWYEAEVLPDLREKVRAALS